MAFVDDLLFVANSRVGLSAFSADTTNYLSLLMRPSEGYAAEQYYLSPATSTCALTVLACWRLAGLTDFELLAPYYPGRVGRAFADVQTIAARHGAWEAGYQGPLRAGDAWIIVDGQGGDGHMGLAVADEDDSTGPRLVKTVEGGQLDPRGGSTAIGAFTRRLDVHGAGTGRVAMMGARHIYGVVRASRLTPE